MVRSPITPVSPRSTGLYERVARPALFRLGGGDAETAHEWTLRRLESVSRRPLTLAVLRRALAVPPLPGVVFGLRFPNPVGLAAGMDKNGVALPAWPALGFGFVEVGTVTSLAQSGHERPRVFRLRSSAAVINRMGFNNAGAARLADRLAALPAGGLGVPLGISLGKSKATPLDAAVDDYLTSLRALYPYGDYFAINVSSPNTPGLRALQDRAQLSELLGALRAEAMSGMSAGAINNAAMSAGAMSAGAMSTAGLNRGTERSGPKPILVKIAPDLTESAIADLLEVCLEHGVAGVIATNTTLSRNGLAPRDVVAGDQAGGLSGAPLAARTREIVAFVHRETSGVLPIVGVGGILTADDAVRLMDAGASLVQLYTGLIYRGPRLIREIVRALSGRVASNPPHLPRSWN